MLDGVSFESVGDINLCLRDTGSGPPVIFLHGTSANLGVWDSVIRELDTGVRSIAIDQRGHGRSSKPSQGYGALEYCSDIASLVRELECGPVVAVGHSLGARNAVVLAAQFPELVSGVVAVDYTPFVEKKVIDDLQIRVAAGNRTFGTKDEVKQYLRERYVLIRDDAVLRRAEYGYAYDESSKGYRPLATREALEATVDGLRSDFDGDVKAIDKPVTLIRGALSRIVSEEALRKTISLRRDFRVVELQNVDHYVPEEEPELIAFEIRKMLDAIGNPSTMIG